MRIARERAQSLRRLAPGIASYAAARIVNNAEA
jgi:hypothetical protein